MEEQGIGYRGCSQKEGLPKQKPNLGSASETGSSKGCFLTFCGPYFFPDMEKSS